MLSLVASAMEKLSPLRTVWWKIWSRRHRVAVILFGLSDADVVQHAMGLPTSIEWGWKHSRRWWRCSARSSGPSDQRWEALFLDAQLLQYLLLDKLNQDREFL